MNNSITIIGGGIVGLSLAALLAKHDFAVFLIEAKPFDLSNNDLTARVSTIHLISAKLLKYLEVEKVLEESAPLYEMKIWDHTQNAQLHFDSRDAGETQMAFVVENRAMIKALYERCVADKNIKILCPELPTPALLEKNNLIVGADGAQSWVRQQMPITLNTRPYFQKAIIAVIASEKPHGNVAIQKFLTTGPVALLPLKNAYHTALVWSADDAISDGLMQKTDDAFSHALTEALDFKLGKLSGLSSRSQFPLVMQHANDYVSQNFALVGDAAHTIHPLAGLGVNLGLMDVACLAQTLIDARDNRRNLGDLKTLRRYARWRKADNNLIIAAMQGLKDLFAIDATSFSIARSFGVNTLDQCVLLKNQLIRMAMGQSNELPGFLKNLS